MLEECYNCNNMATDKTLGSRCRKGITPKKSAGICPSFKHARNANVNTVPTGDITHSPVSVGLSMNIIAR
jgi:hypothetical protein